MALASPYVLEIMEQENPPRETEEMAQELEGNPGPSLSLELREEQESRWQDQPPESGSPMDKGRGGEKRPNSIWQTGGWTVEGSLVSSMAAAGGHRGESQGLLLRSKLSCRLKERADKREMGSKCQWRAVNVFVLKNPGEGNMVLPRQPH